MNARLAAVPTPSDRSGYRPLKLRRMAVALRVLAADLAACGTDRPADRSAGAAEILVALWDGHLRHHPAIPSWPDRDRLVLAAGGESALLEALRRLGGDATPIPPDRALAHAVGLALAERRLADAFNRDDHGVVDHRTWAILDERALSNAAARAACALAGARGLHKLVVVLRRDEGSDGTDTDATPEHFRARGWHLVGPIDGHDPEALDAALGRAGTQGGAPTLVVCRVRSALAQTRSAALGGAPAGTSVVVLAREAAGWRYPPFVIPRDVHAAWDARERGEAACRDWQRRLVAYRAACPAQAAEFDRRMQARLPRGFALARIAVLTRFGRPAADGLELDPAATLSPAATAALRSRTPRTTAEASAVVLAMLAPMLPELVATAAGSDAPAGAGTASPAPVGGIALAREARRGAAHRPDPAAAASGLAAHGGFVPIRAGADAAEALRHATTTPCRGVYLLRDDPSPRRAGNAGDGGHDADHDHDTRADGDGETDLRAALPETTRGVDLWRPCDPAETAMAWLVALGAPARPSALLLSCVPAPAPARTPEQVLAIRRGGYLLADRDDAVAALVANGPRIAPAIEAQRILERRGIRVRLVSMPSPDVFARQDAAWRESVLPPGLPRIEVTAGAAPTADALAARVLAQLRDARAGTASAPPEAMRLR